MKAEHKGHPILRFANRDAFAAWLAAHGQPGHPIWLAFAKKGAPQPTLAKADAIEVALCHGWIDGQADRLDDHHWLIRFTPRGPRSLWSAVNVRIAERLIAEGAMQPPGLTQVESARADGRWAAAYPSPAEATVPADLAAALALNPAATTAFAALNAARRYAILHRIHIVKRPETRAARIADFAARLAKGDPVP